MNVSNRTLAIIASTLVIGAILHIEYRIDRLSEKVDIITDVIINSNQSIKHTPAERECLVKNIYYEAGIEDVLGKYAVGHVTINRLRSGKWGNDICSVVYAKKQFSWTLKKKLPKPNPAMWAESQFVADQILKGAKLRGLDRSLFYHADYIRTPHWADPDQHVKTIGRHIFYNNAKQGNRT